MQRALQPFLRRGVFRAATRSRIQLRRQHELPHKEYFQQPGQFPEQLRQNFQPPIPAHPPSQAIAAGPSYFRRAFRSISWAILFSVLGVWAGAGLITWEYIQPPFDFTEEEENELLDDILVEMREHPLVVGLMEDGWSESKVYPERSRWEMEQGLELVYERLMGTQGITIKEFTHPTLDYTVLVFFLADGLEGWPDTVHGGIISTMLLVAAQRHIERYYLEEGEEVDSESLRLEVNFKARVQPADIHSILVPPAGKVSGVHPQTGNRVTSLKLSPMMLQMDAAPQISEASVNEPHSVIHNVQIPTTAVGEAIYAIATVDCRIASNKGEAPNQP